jgi:DNA-binding IclR family transcriptional regulator
MIRPSPQTERVVKVISMLAQPGSTLSLAEISRRLDVNKSTCYSMMTELTRNGWAIRDPTTKLFVIGPAMIDLSRNATDAFPALRIAHPAMSQLSYSLGVNCSAVRATDTHIVMMEQVKDIRTSWDPFLPGVQFMLEAPYGAYFMAYSPESAVERWMAAAPDSQHPYLARVLEQCRKQGFLVERSPTQNERLEATHRGHGSVEETVFALQALVATEGDYYITEWERHRDYPIGLIGSPIIGRAGTVELLLTLSGFSELLTGAQIDDMARALCKVTSSLTSALMGS